MFKHLPKDPASVNAMKSVFLHILPDSNQNRTENTAKTLKYPLVDLKII